MNPELKKLLILLAIGASIGSVIGLAVRKNKPEWCRGFIKFSYNRNWKLFLTALIVLTAMAVISFSQGRPYFGALFAVFAVLEGYALLRYGFRPISPEMEAKMDACYPPPSPPDIASKEQEEQVGPHRRREET